MSFLSRNKIYEKQLPKKDAKKVYILTEGLVREVEYFRYFVDLSTNINIIPIPSRNGKTDPLKLKDTADLFFKSSQENIPHFILSPEYEDEV